MDGETQSCHTTVTSLACGRGRGLSRGRGHDASEGAISRVIPPRYDSPLPGLRARPLPEGEVPLRQTVPNRKHETFFISPGLGRGPGLVPDDPGLALDVARSTVGMPVHDQALLEVLADDNVE